MLKMPKEPYKSQKGSRCESVTSNDENSSGSGEPHNFSTINFRLLSRIFDFYKNSKISKRNFFIDYCFIFFLKILRMICETTPATLKKTGKKRLHLAT